MTFDSTTIMVVASLASVATLGIGIEHKRHTHSRRAFTKAEAEGRPDPPTIYPLIDPTLCIACGSCVAACPENGVLRVVNGRARLVDAAHCVGHGRCKPVCPTQAIELVFGTAKRGVLVPSLGADLQSSVPGIYVAGELGGFGLIRTAVTQGVQAVDNLKATPIHDPSVVDVAIVGAGPAGIAAALACRERGLSHIVLDQDGLGGTVNHYPRRKLVMTAPVKLPVVGPMDFREVLKEELIEFWEKVVAKADIKLNGSVKVTDITREGERLRLKWKDGDQLAQRVILATGRRGSPRKLGVPGEETEKVAYRLIEPDQFTGQRVIVVGGGNCAVEGAMSLAEAGAQVVLSHRGDRYTSVAAGNLTKLETERGPSLEVLLNSQVRRIETDRAEIKDESGERSIGNDYVFVMIGGELPTKFLEKIGVETTTYYGEPPRAPKAAPASSAA